MARLVLIGLPGVGKSAVARALANAWGCEAIDTDSLVALAVGEATSDYLRRVGEPSFRQREVEVLREAMTHDAVIATGGGIVTTPEAREVLTNAVTVWLDVDDDTLAKRVKNGDRPLLGSSPATALLRLRKERSDWYGEVARVRIDASGDVTQVAERVRASLAGEQS